MVYVAGQADHKVDNASMIDHIVGLIEDRARAIRESSEPAKG
jgi:(E)-4-hydroxy-3-methylbut-2-enyl-diphosphate synthase